MTRARLVVAAALVLIPGSMDTVWAGDGVVALQTADASCPDDSGNIYVDCGNGTVTDNRTGLVWLKDANCIGSAGGGTGGPGIPLGRVDWFTARDFAAGLSDKPETSVGAADDCGLADGSSPGEWRLPSVEEWEAMTADAVALGCILGEFGGPSVTDDSGTQCWREGPGNSFTGVVSGSYWSASTVASIPAAAWDVPLQGGSFALAGKDIIDYVWPVRGGQ